jgi:hypothetical protein
MRQLGLTKFFAWFMAFHVALGVTLTAARADDAVVRRFATGSAPNAIGFASSDNGDDHEEDGPQALTSDETGRLFVLDQVNQRIVSFAPGSPESDPQYLNLPKDLEPTDLIVKQDTVYAWDGKIHALQPLGQADAPTRGLTETRSVEDTDVYTSTAFSQMGSMPPPQLEDTLDESSTRGVGAKDKSKTGDKTKGKTKAKPLAKAERQFIETSGHGSVVADITITDAGAGAQLSVKGKDGSAIGKLHLRVPDKLGTVAFLGIDKTGHMFVLAENVPQNIADAAFAFVARYSANGVLEGSYELPLKETTSISRRSVTISPDGNVYFLKTNKKAVEVIVIGFRPMPNAKIITSAESHSNFAATSWADTGWVGMAVGPLSRQSIIQTALGYEGIKWTLGPSNYGSEQDQVCTGFNGRIRRPMYLIGSEGKDVHSVPYCWGCQGSLSQFAQRVQRGALAGNVCTKDGIRPDTVGVDCSSFVSATWGLSTHFTTAAIPAIAARIDNPWDLQPGDALDKPGSHVVLFMGFTAQRQALVMEASPGACKGKVCRNVYPLSSLLARGFVPVRYRALAEGKPEAASPPAKAANH